MPTHESRILALHNLEQQHNLFSYCIDGWSAWRVLRNPVSRYSLSLPTTSYSSHTFRRILRSIKHTILFARLLYLGKSNDLIVKTCRTALRLHTGHLYRDVYFDGVLESFPSFIKIEEKNTTSFDARVPFARFPASFDPVVFTFWGRVMSLAFPVRKALPFCVYLSELILSELDIAIPSRWLLRLVSTAYWQSRLYSVFIRISQPKAVLVADTGEYGLLIACKRNKVTLVELQHGFFDNMHPDAIPDWVDGTAFELLLPDILACRGQYWINHLRNTLQGQNHAVPVGNEIIDLARQQRQHNSHRDYFHFVLTLQGIDSQRLLCWIQEFISCAPDNLAWKLTIKPHPAYDSDRAIFSTLSDDRVNIPNVDDASNTFELLANADAHLSISSACHFDAVAIGVPTFVIPLLGHELMLPSIDNILINLARHPSDPWHFQVPSYPHSYISSFSKPGFIENMSRLLYKLQVSSH